MPWLREALAEWMARRRGARYLDRRVYTAAREIVGPTGSMFSSGWKEFETGQDAYLRSFDPRVPPSIHISHRDMTRANIPVPLVERCIEDWNDKGTPPSEE